MMSESKVSVRTLIFSTVRRFKIRELTEADIQDMIEWAWNGINLIGSYPSFKEVVNRKLKIENGMALLPCDIIQWRKIVIGGQTIPFAQDVPRDKVLTSGVGLHGYWIDWPYLKLGEKANEILHTGEIEVLVSYQTIENDGDGNPLIRESHIDALSYYLAANYWMGRPNSPFNYRELMADWDFKCGQARGNDSFPDPGEHMTISGIWNNIVGGLTPSQFYIP